MKEEFISLYQLYKTLEENNILWIKSYPTLKRWVKKDSETNNILGVVIVGGPGTSKRYFIPKDKVKDFVESFNNGTLYVKGKKRKV